jgi:ornithine cyclodeaminase/alanine dehydrogenase
MRITVLSREDVKSVLEMPRVVAAVEQVYRAKAAGETVVWPLVCHEFEHAGGAMDIRSGYVAAGAVHGLKMLNNFPRNAEKGIPAFNGMMMVFDSDTGLPLGVLDASHITCMRTGAAGALGVKALARADCRRLLVLGAGKQAAFQIAATLILQPEIERVLVADPHDPRNARSLADALPRRLREEFHLKRIGGVRFEAADDLAGAVASSDAIITVTRARRPVIHREWVRPGTHFSCIGADMEGKEEIDPLIFRGARVFADDKPQCMRVGEMQTPLAQGVIGEDDIAGELGHVLAGSLAGRTNDEEITIFDATGLAPLDLVTAKLAIELAIEKGIGTRVDM